jgi:hypothetical protein
MKRLFAALIIAFSLGGIAHAAFGIFQTYAPGGSSFNPVTVASEQHVWGMDPSNPAVYLVPGNGAPAISTASFYNSAGMYNTRPYDLDTMGSTGAAVKASNGGKRYAWVFSADHPSNNAYSWVGGEGFYVGYSSQPWDFPKTVIEIARLSLWGTYQTAQHTISGGFQTYEFPHITYNPDDPDGLPIYLFAEAGPVHWTSLLRSNDFVTFTPKEISHWHTTDVFAVAANVAAGGSGYSAGTQLLTVTGGTCTSQPQFNVTVVAGAITAPVVAAAGQCSVNPANPVSTTGGGGTGGTLTLFYGQEWSSFLRYNQRTGTNAFTSIALSNVAPTNSIWTTTNGIDYTTTGVPILGLQGSPDSAGSQFYLGTAFTVGSQLYGVGKEEATGGGNNQYCTIWPMDSATFDKQSSPAKVRIASGWANTGFPGPTFLQECSAFYEDGLVYVMPTYGFVSDVNTTAGNSSRGGAPYSGGGGLDQQFIDKIVVRVDDVAARLAAPVGVTVSAVSGTATISWKDALPQNTNRLYRGTTSGTQATLIGDYTGVTSATDSPPTGRYWYKLVTLDGGVERQSRVVSVYVSSSSAFINEHMDRALEDGADPATCNRPFMDRADALLTSEGIRSILQLWTHPAFCVKHSANVISKIYDLGTTRLPRSLDFKTTTSNTTYSATSVNTGPGWTNANTTAYGYWGDLKRGNTIQQKRELTIIAAYERSQTSSDLTFVGTGPIWGVNLTGDAILTLKHTAGSPGNIEFSLSDETSTKTATVAASGSGLQFATGTYDGTSMFAYTGTTAGTAVTTLDPNPNFGRTSGTPGYILGSLAGARNYLSSGTQNNSINSAFGFRKVIPFLGSGSVHSYTLKTPDGSNDATNFNEANSQGKFQSVMVLEGKVNGTQLGNIITSLQSTANW